MVVIYVDEREKSSEVPKLLTARGASIVFKVLEVGDYVVSERVGIERKSASDFIRSIVDGRLFDQASRLKKVFEKPVIIVEGSIARALKFSKIHRNAVIGAQLALSIDMGVSLVFTRTPEETADTILLIARREQEKRGGVKALSPRAPKLASIEERQLYVLQSLPHVGPKIARRILEIYGSLRNFFCNASLRDLAAIEGLGEKRAAEIIQVINAVYREYAEKGRRVSRSIVDYLRQHKQDEVSSSPTQQS